MTRASRLASVVVGLGLLAWLALPARADTTPFGLFAMTVLAGATTTAGSVGASGGLVTLDSGSAYVRARLDSGPSSSVLADPVEPGTLGRSVIGTLNSCPTSPGPCLPAPPIVYPDALANYPGQGQAQLQPVPPTAIGPLSVSAGTASATAAAERASGATTASAYDLAGVFSSGGSATTADLSRAGDALTDTADSTLASLVVPGGLTLKNVKGTATIRVQGGVRTVTAGTTVGGAAVAGTPVVIDDNGVTVATQQVPLGPLQQTTQQVNQALASAGVSVHMLEPTRRVTSTGALADSGGVVITITTPGLPIGANTLVLQVGRVVETETDAPASASPVTAPPPPPPATSTTTTTYTSGQPGSAPGPPPAQPAPLLTRYLAVGGVRITALEALVVFALWQALTLSAPTATTLLRRRRRARVRAGW